MLGDGYKSDILFTYSIQVRQVTEGKGKRRTPEIALMTTSNFCSSNSLHDIVGGERVET